MAFYVYSIIYSMYCKSVAEKENGPSDINCQVGPQCADESVAYL